MTLPAPIPVILVVVILVAPVAFAVRIATTLVSARKGPAIVAARLLHHRRARRHGLIPTTGKRLRKLLELASIEPYATALCANIDGHAFALHLTHANFAYGTGQVRHVLAPLPDADTQRHGLQYGGRPERLEFLSQHEHEPLEPHEAQPVRTETALLACLKLLHTKEAKK